MRDEILKILNQIENKHNIKIIYAVESGSRGWGFASKDSDWDVRYIYIHNLDWYLQIEQQKDTQEVILPNKIDLSGWELKKALNLFKKSNPPLLEWLSSPIVYIVEKYSTINKLRELAQKFFNPKSSLYHYMHMAIGNYKEYLQGKDIVKLKKYLYILRPILACDWIKETNTPAPMEFSKLVDSQVTDPNIKLEINNLVSRKISGEELGEEPAIPLLNKLIIEKIDFYSKYLPTLKYNNKVDIQLLNQIFKDTLFEAWNNF